MFNNTFRNLRRTREIIAILVKYGFEDVITNSTLRNLVTERRRLTWLRQEKPVFEYTRWERIRMAAEELGPTFIKLAQVLSNRPDMLPEALIKEFEKLQDNVPPFEFEKVKSIIKTETGQEIEEMFDNFSEKPLASASIGQVHRARLKTGEEVVVKIQRPDIAETIDQDLNILKDAVERADRYLKKQGVLNAQDVVRTFDRSMRKELDYRNEARNIQKFREFYKDYKNFYIPRAYKEHSTDKILIIEFAEGCKINNAAQLKKWGLNPEKVAENGMSIYLTQIFEYGYFHADPHPGNVLVRRDGVICLIDFGMVGTLMPKDKANFAGIFISIAQRDARQMANYMKRLAITDEIHDMRALQYDLQELIEDYADLDLSESNMADMVTQLQKIMYDHQIVVTGSVFLIFRAFAILEGIGKQIHPHFNTYDFMRPYGQKIVQNRFQPKNILSEVTYRLDQLNELLIAVPRDAREIISKLKKGKLHFEIEHQGYGYLLKKLDSLTNRISLTILIAACLVGSAISMNAEWPEGTPTYYGIPEVSYVGLWIAGGLFLMLIYSVIRRRKYK